MTDEYVLAEMSAPAPDEPKKEPDEWPGLNAYTTDRLSYTDEVILYTYECYAPDVMNWHGETELK